MFTASFPSETGKSAFETNEQITEGIKNINNIYPNTKQSKFTV
jgi:hypothetical protein